MYRNLDPLEAQDFIKYFSPAVVGLLLFIGSAVADLLPGVWIGLALAVPVQLLVFSYRRWKKLSERERQAEMNLLVELEEEAARKDQSPSPHPDGERFDP